MENNGEIIFYQPDEAVRLEVRLENETICKIENALGIV